MWFVCTEMIDIYLYEYFKLDREYNAGFCGQIFSVKVVRLFKICPQCLIDVIDNKL